MAQTTDTVLMIRPVITKELSNLDNIGKSSSKQITSEVENVIIKEFDEYVRELRLLEIIVMEIQDTPQPWTPESIFPTYWMSVHSKSEMMREGKKIECKALKSEEKIIDLPEAENYIVLYPMPISDRRIEKYKTPTKILKEHFGEKAFFVDLSEFEKENKFLEGTGSMVLDRENKIIYACRSDKNSEEVIQRFANLFNYRYFIFETIKSMNVLYEHTDNIISIGRKFAIVCFDAIKNENEKKDLKYILKQTDKEIIEISLEQANQFAGNIIELKTIKDGIAQPVYIISQNAKNSLSESQLKQISDYALIVSPNICQIEKIHQGSVKCMLGEIF